MNDEIAPTDENGNTNRQWNNENRHAQSPVAIVLAIQRSAPSFGCPERCASQLMACSGWARSSGPLAPPSAGAFRRRPLISFLLKVFLRKCRVMLDDEDNRARAYRCLHLAREAVTLENRLRWAKQAEFRFRLSEQQTEPEKHSSRGGGANGGGKAST